MISRIVQPKRRGRRPLTALAILAVVAGSLLASGIALAVHDESFQLDGDVDHSTTTVAGGHTQLVDWDQIFSAGGAAQDPLPTGFKDAGFFPDFNINTNGTFNTSDQSTYATGSKDTLPISGWQCNLDNNVNSKVDVMNAYTVSGTNAAGDKIAYFALERNTNTGTADVGFWFLQADIGCKSTGAAVTFGPGAHLDGDVLVVSEFSNGGTVSTINVYRWDRNNGSADCPDGPGCVINQPGVPGFLNPTPIGIGADCRGASFPAGDPACAVSNTTANGTGGTITTPWLTANFKDKVGHSLRTSEFFEGGINLTDLKLGGKCFNTFIGDTRSSTSLTATLFDFAAGQTGACDSHTVTTPNLTGHTDIPGDPSDAKLLVHDTAAVTVDGIATFDATVSFHLCGPTAADSAALCTSGGVDVGSKPVTTNGNIQSDDTWVTSAGRYCWRADFSGDDAAGVPSSSDSSSSECFIVDPRTPHIVTHAGSSPVNFGDPVTDTATLTNTAHEPGTGGPAGSDGSIGATTLGGDALGKITFTLYKSDCSTPAVAKSGSTGVNPQTVDVLGDNTYGPVSFTPDAPGTYHWVASYAGDLPNTTASPAADSVCGADPNEDVIVRTIPTSISTAQRVYPNDWATITSSVAGDNLPSAGVVTFRLYDSLTSCQAHGDTLNSGGLIYKQVLNNVGGAHSVIAKTTNTTVEVSASGTYYWYVTYATGDTAHVGRQSDCLENTVLTFNNDTGPGTTFP